VIAVAEDSSLKGGEAVALTVSRDESGRLGKDHQWLRWEAACSCVRGLMLKSHTRGKVSESSGMNLFVNGTVAPLIGADVPVLELPGVVRTSSGGIAHYVKTEPEHSLRQIGCGQDDTT